MKRENLEKANDLDKEIYNLENLRKMFNDKNVVFSSDYRRIYLSSLTDVTRNEMKKLMIDFINNRIKEVESKFEEL